ncbi:hypothetical protein DN396_24765 [Bacillus sp. BF9-10]|nr:hypothetical protein DN396_24765 [Bacillus sp. BF9-10]
MIFYGGQTRFLILGHIPISRPRGIPSGIKDTKRGAGAYALAIFTFK